MKNTTAWYLLPVKYLWVGAREFWDAEGFSRASALAYTTLLSLIPLTVVVLSIWGAVRDEELKESEVVEDTLHQLLWPAAETFRIQPAPGEEPIPEVFGDEESTDVSRSELEALQEKHGAEKFQAVKLESTSEMVVTKLTEFVANLRADLKTIGIIGALFLLFTTISLFNSIEANLNELWVIRARRNPIRKFLVLWALLTLGPILLAASLVVRARYFTDTLNAGLDHFVVPYLFTWAAFFFLYRFVPATRVNTTGAVVAAFVAGCLWEVGKVVFSRYVFELTTKATVTSITYGSLALIPIFLLWLYISWLFALFGVKLCYVWQHIGSYSGKGWKALPVSTESQELLAAEVVARVVEEQYTRGRGMTLEALALALRFPQHRLEAAIDTLRRAGILTEAADGDRLVTVVPPDKLTLEDVTCAVRGSGEYTRLSNESGYLRKIAGLLGLVDERRRRILSAASYASLVRESIDVGDTAADTVVDAGPPDVPDTGPTTSAGA